jgi:hypothetical protein
MIEVIILVPVANNDGRTFAAPHHRAFERFMMERFGGFTRLSGHAQGGWVDRATGREYRDATILYMVGVEGLVGNEGLREAASFAKSHYQQEAILLRYLGVAEII